MRPVMPVWPAVFLSLGMFLSCPAAEDIHVWLDEPDTLWEIPPDQVLEADKKAMVWADTEQTVLYCRDASKTALSFGEYKFADVRFTFADNALVSIRMCMLPPGKDAAWDDSLPQAARRLSAELEKKCGSYVVKRDFRSLPTGVKVVVEYRKSPVFHSKMVCGIPKRGGSGGFLKLILSKPDMEEKDDAVPVLSKKVQIAGDEHEIPLPMIEAAEKGLVIPATLERLLIHFGKPFGQHEIAGVLEIDKSKGIDFDKLFTQLLKFDGKLGLQIVNIYRLEGFDRRRYGQTVRRYNSLARRLKSPVLPAPKIGALSDFALEPFVAMRGPHVPESFFNTVCSYVDKGIPLLWTVLLFPDDETANKTKKISKHIRLITGYNRDSKEIIFTDVWGSGHEKKMLPLDHAWSITLRLNVLKPIY